MPREDAATKARRLVAEGRLTILNIGRALIVAECKGDSGEVYKLGYAPSAGWTCDCEARGRCSHLRSLQLVTLRPKEPGREPAAAPSGERRDQREAVVVMPPLRSERPA